MRSVAIFNPPTTSAEAALPISTTIYIVDALLLLRKLVYSFNLLAQQGDLRFEARNLLLELGLSIVIFIDCRIFRSYLGLIVGYNCFEVGQLHIIFFVLPQSNFPVFF